jgi:c-di-GMP-related signal transduction protein
MKVEFNYIHGLHALIQQLIDQGRMPVSDAVQKALGESRVQLRQIIREVETKEGKKPCPLCSSWAEHKRAIYCMDCGSKIK